MKEKAKSAPKQEKRASKPPESPAHLAFRHIVVHAFERDTKPEALRFHYTERVKYLSHRRAA